MTRNTSTNNKKGFSLIELCIAIGILAILTGSITSVFIKRIQVKAGEKTAVEMSVIQQAASAYFVANKTWPVNIQALQSAGYLNPSWVTNNPWQNAYTITSNALSFSVSTLLPKGLITNISFGSEVVVVNQGNNDLVSVTKSPESRNWKLKYEKKYLYKQ